MDSAQFAIAAGLALGLVAGYRAGAAVMRKVTGSHAGKPLVMGLAVAGAFGFLAPASLFAVLAARRLAGGASAGTLLLLALGIALVIASGLVVGVFAGSFAGSFIEQVRERARFR